MELRLERRWYSDECTIGDLLLNGKHECWTLEDHFPTPYVKAPGFTCIPEGRYEVIINHSERFGVDMPLLVDVPDFRGIRIHSGNTAVDTDGCILVGEALGYKSIGRSIPAYAVLYSKLHLAVLNGEKIHITVVRKEAS